MAEIDIVFCQIIQDFMGLAVGRVAVYNQEFVKPTDKEIFVVVSTGQSKIVSNTRKFDDATNEDVNSIVSYTQIIAEMTSVNRTALDRRHEIFMAISSTLGVRAQEENNIKIMRNGDILDLSAVDGAKSLHRFRIPVIISHMKIKRTAIEPIDKFPPLEVL